MPNHTLLNYIKAILDNMPNDWLNLTTHRLDIYNESQAKTEFLDQFKSLFDSNNSEATALSELPTAYDYIRLGHPLSSILEWTIANLHNITSEQVISFSSQTMPVLAILRQNSLNNKNTQILYTGQLPEFFNSELIKRVYGYNFELKNVENIKAISNFVGSTVLISNQDKIEVTDLNANIDFYIKLYHGLGSVILINGESNTDYISEIQHVRRRETIAMTPANCLVALKALTIQSALNIQHHNLETHKATVLNKKDC